MAYSPSDDNDIWINYDEWSKLKKTTLDVTQKNKNKPDSLLPKEEGTLLRGEKVQKVLFNIVTWIEYCASQLNNNYGKNVVTDKVIDNLDGEEVEVLLFDDQLRIRVRLSKVTPPAAENLRESVFLIVKTIEDCVSDLNNYYNTSVVADQVIDNLDGEEVDVLLYGDQLRFHARLSKVEPSAKRSIGEKMFSFLDRQTRPDCPFKNSEDFQLRFKLSLGALIQNFDLDDINKSLYRKTHNSLRSGEYEQRKKFATLKKIYQEKLDTASFSYITLTNDELIDPAFAQSVHNMCASLIYLQDIVKNVNKIPLRRVSAFLQLLFTALGRMNPFYYYTRGKVGNIERVLSIIKRMVESYRNLGLIELVEANQYGVFRNQPRKNSEDGLENHESHRATSENISSNLSSGTRRKRRRNRTCNHHSKKTRHCLKKGTQLPKDT
jgi:hypothetical protein